MHEPLLQGRAQLLKLASKTVTATESSTKDVTRAPHFAVSLRAAHGARAKRRYKKDRRGELKNFIDSLNVAQENPEIRYDRIGRKRRHRECSRRREASVIDVGFDLCAKLRLAESLGAVAHRARRHP